METDGGAANSMGEGGTDSAEEVLAWRINATQALHSFQLAVRRGEMSFSPDDQPTVIEAMAVSLAPRELLGETALSDAALDLVAQGATAVERRWREAFEPRTSIGVAEAQRELFEHFHDLFAAATGRRHEEFASHQALADTLRTCPPHLAERRVDPFMQAMARLREFYQAHARNLGRHAGELGGVKLALGGNRLFGPGTLAAVRKMVLYADTQLIPDPVNPMLFEGEALEEGSGHYLLLQLYHLLQLTPLVEAALPVPPVLVVPGFEKTSAAHHVETQRGIHELAAEAVGTACGVPLTTSEDLQEFARSEPERFIEGVMRDQLFIPPFADVGTYTDVRAAADRYLRDIALTLPADAVAILGRRPLSELILGELGDRFGSQYHLLRNAETLGAQPMLTHDVAWHFFKKASAASALHLHREEVLSAASLQTLRALQNERLAWLAHVPLPVLAQLRANGENAAFREALAAHTATLTAAGPADLDRVVREVCHGIESMVQAHQKVIGELEAKYTDKYWNTGLPGGFGTVIGVAAHFLPMLAAFGPPAGIAAAGLAGKLAVDRFMKGREVRRARASLLGVLATTPRK